MDLERIESLEKRLAQYERVNRRWKGLGLLGAGSLAVLLVVGWAPDKKAPAPMEVDGSLVIKKDGKIVARLGSTGSGPALQLFASDQQGNEEKSRAWLGIEGDDGVLHIYSKNDKASCNLKIDKSAGGRVETFNNTGKQGWFPQ
ncbi:hypothetical protein HY251_05505 [bacterium]|nr:hypothetical protein [bacterium]